MGHVLSTGLELISSGKSAHLDNDLRQGLEKMSSLAAKGNITPREKQHVQAVQEWSDGYEKKHKKNNNNRRERDLRSFRKNSEAPTGFEPMTFVIPVRCSTD